MKSLRVVLPFLFLVVMAGCGDESDPIDPADDDSTADTGTDGDGDTTGTDGDTDTTDTGTDTDDTGTDTGDVPDGPDMARLQGVVTRSVQPQAGGVGNIYIAVFDRDPVLAPDSAKSVGAGFVENADLSVDDTSVEYEVLDIPVRDEPYYLIAFLDDNGTVDQSDPDNAGPDKGDLLSMQGLASPSVVLDASGDTEFDIELNVVLPF